jgi:hypothetical protein
MGYVYYAFGFNFVKRNGKKTGRLRLNGVLDSKGITFDGIRLNYQDFFKVMRQHNRLLFILYPAIAFPKALNDFILPDTNSFIVDVAEENVFLLKSHIDQHYSKLSAEAHREKLKAEGKENYFKTVSCPRCDSTIDLSLKKSSPYVFCQYCELVFSKHGKSVMNTDDYKICPECEYFNRVQYFPDAEVYYYRSESAFHFGSKYHCDSCAQADFERQIWRNLPYLLALPQTFMKKMKIDGNTHPTLKDVMQAVLYAQRLEIEQAEALFQSLSIYNEWHPAVYYNRGKAYMDYAQFLEENAGSDEDRENAKMVRNKGLNDLKKSLQGCSNFEPTLELLRDNSEYEVIMNEEG